MEDSSKVIHAFYTDDDVLMAAVKKVRAERYHIEEIYTPFPVHGLDTAMGLAPTRIAITSFLYGPLSKISELKEFGEKLLSIIKEFVPYLEKSIESYSNYSNNPFDYMESLANRPKIKIASKKAKLIHRRERNYFEVLNKKLQWGN